VNNDVPPSNVPNQGPIELQLLAIQRELSFFKSYYVEMNKKLEKIHETVGHIEHMDLFVKITKIIDEYINDKRN
jgi:hypothetical protein